MYISAHNTNIFFFVAANLWFSVDLFLFWCLYLWWLFGCSTLWCLLHSYNLRYQITQVIHNFFRLFLRNFIRCRCRCRTLSLCAFIFMVCISWWTLLWVENVESILWRPQSGEMALITRNVLHKLIFKWNIPSDLFIHSRRQQLYIAVLNTNRTYVPLACVWVCEWVSVCTTVWMGFDAMCVSVYKCESCYSIECVSMCASVYECAMNMESVEFIGTQRQPPRRNNRV